MKASNIKWDTDGYSPKKLGLPKTVDIPKGIYDLDEISDYLSDTYEFCHQGFKITYTEEDVRNCLLQEFSENEYDLDNLKKMPQAVIDTILQEANTSQQDLLSVICNINVSKTQGFVMCQFGDNEFYFNEYASNSCSFDEFLTSVSKICPNYSYLNVAKDIAKTIIDMRSYDPTESLYYLYLMKEKLPPFYDDILGHYIELAEKAEQELEDFSL